MKLFDAFRKKEDGPGPGPEQPAAQQAEDWLDDSTYIRDMKHTSDGPWQTYDVLLDVRGYGWQTMLDWADDVCGADLEDISQVLSFSGGTQEDNDVTASYHAHNDRCLETPELEAENGGLSVGGVSRTLKAPMKIVWYNQTNILRFITRYVETVIRRTFGTEDAMKAGRPLREG